MKLLYDSVLNCTPSTEPISGAPPIYYGIIHQHEDCNQHQYHRQHQHHLLHTNTNSNFTYCTPTPPTITPAPTLPTVHQHYLLYTNTTYCAPTLPTVHQHQHHLPYINTNTTYSTPNLPHSSNTCTATNNTNHYCTAREGAARLTAVHGVSSNGQSTGDLQLFSVEASVSGVLSTQYWSSAAPYFVTLARI